MLDDLTEGARAFKSPPPVQIAFHVSAIERTAAVVETPACMTPLEPPATMRHDVSSRFVRRRCKLSAEVQTDS